MRPLYLLLIVTFLLSACSGSKDDTASTDELTVPDIATITVSRITFSVPSFESWFEIYMKEQPFRQNANLQTMGIFIDSKAENSYHIFLRAESVAQLNQYFDSESYYSSFSIPSNEVIAREIIDVTQLEEKTFDHEYRLLISHKVKDYPEWKTVFDSDATIRESYGLETVGVGRSIEDPSLIYVMFAFNDEEKVKQYVDGDDLRSNLKEAGVIGQLNITQVSPIQGITF